MWQIKPVLLQLWTVADPGFIDRVGGANPLQVKANPRREDFLIYFPVKIKEMGPDGRGLDPPRLSVT